MFLGKLEIEIMDIWWFDNKVYRLLWNDIIELKEYTLL